MGLLDAIKRWRLTQQGLSSGRKRRVYSGNPLIEVLENSIWVRLSLYATFAVGCAVLVLKSASASSFAQDPFRGSLFGMMIAVTAVVMFQVSLKSSCSKNSRVVLVLGGLIGHLMVVRLVLTTVQAGNIDPAFHFFFVPFALAPMLHGVLLGRAVGAFSAVFVTLIGCLFTSRDQTLTYMILSLISGVTGVLLTHQIRKRLQLLQAGIYLGAATVTTGLLLGGLDIMSCFGPEPMRHLGALGTGSAAAFGTGVLTALVISALLPVFEGIFQLTTDISWLELSDLNHKLLREMQLEAPGSFHHSLIVASLAEAAAEKIGANAPMCRVCSYFHDIGKLTKPGYFIENQTGGEENPHDSLTPTMSALIIIAHVKDGIDLAVKHKLNSRIINVIQEHHGDSLVAYFHRRAQEQKKVDLEKIDRKLENPEDLPAIDEKNFRYPGPCPSTRESGIIALADAVESASRTLKKPTPARIRALVEDLTLARIQDGQLDQCPLTLKELAVVKESFAGTLRSMMHSRIAYPTESRDADSTIASHNRAVLEHKTQKGNRVVPMPTPE